MGWYTGTIKDQPRDDICCLIIALREFHQNLFVWHLVPTAATTLGSRGSRFSRSRRAGTEIAGGGELGTKLSESEKTSGTQGMPRPDC